MSLDNSHLSEETQRRINQIKAINRVAATVSQTLDINETMNTALETVLEVVGGEAAGISLIDEEAQEVVMRAQLGWPADFVTQPMRIPIDKGMSGQVIRTNDAVVNNNLGNHVEMADPRFRETGFQSIALTPMHARGEIVGILSIMSHQSGQFDEEMVAILKVIADTVGVAVDNARLYESTSENQNRLEAILHSTADGIIATDRDSRIRLVNQTAADILRIDPEAVVGTPLRSINLLITIREQLLFALMPDSDQSTRSFQASIGDERQLSIVVSPVNTESQILDVEEADGWVIIFQDITHLKEEELARARFIQAAAHDMKNPLSATKTAIALLTHMLPETDKRIQEIIDLANMSVDRLQTLIDDLLQIEKIDSGLGFNPTEADIRELLYEVSMQIEPLMIHKELDFNTDFQKNIPKYVTIDCDWMKRALHNYLENATKYVAAGGHIEMRVYAEDAMLHMEVRDDGPGIPAAAQPQLFNRFYRVDESAPVSGSGLGLAIVKSVAERHGGRVYVESTPGQGSTFGITIPLQ